jgi:hypothetical protein
LCRVQFYKLPLKTNRDARHDVAVKFVSGNHVTMYDDPELVKNIESALEAM